MSPSERAERVPAEVLAIAVALAVAWEEAEVGPASPPERSRWRWQGRTWPRQATYRWS